MAFEDFVQSFHSAIVGTNYVPLGGVHDGGADGFEERIFESEARASQFLQASKTPQIERKIRETVKRIREVGREPKGVLFYFSEPISKADIIEENLSIELDINIRIRSKSYILANINSSPQTVQSFKSHLQPAVTSLMGVGGAGKERDFPFSSKTACAFIGQEINRRRGNASLLDALTDSLILWSLEGTDPATKQFMTYDEILAKITEAIPAAKQFIKSNLRGKLNILSSKSNPSGREVSWHKKEGGYALRFEERQKLLLENAEELRLHSAVGDEIIEASRERLPERLHGVLPQVVAGVRECLEIIFRKQGLDLGVYLSGEDDAKLEGIDLVEDVDRLAMQIAPKQSDVTPVRDCLVEAVRKMIYAPSADQRDYMQRLSATYFVLFALKNEPRIVEYFSGMSQNLVLYIGSDLLIKAISEYHLPPSGRLITNTLEIIRNSGSRIVLTEPALEEVFTHIHASILEFENYYMSNEGAIGEDFVPIIDRILIRAYFYARLGLNTDGKAPSGWKSYIGQFCSYEDVRRKRGQRGLQLYLCDRFGLQYEQKTEMLKGLDRAQHSKLLGAVLDIRGAKKLRSRILAYNDAMQALRVLSKRVELNEGHVPNPYGFKTWWLTHERATERASASAFGGQMPRFVMRPEFLLNYIGLLPSKAEVLKSYKNIFPSVLAVSLGRRAPSDVIKGVLLSAKKVSEIDESRAKVMLSEFSDQLKADKLRLYENEIVMQ